MKKANYYRRFVLANLIIFAVPFLALSLFFGINSMKILRQDAVETPKAILNISDMYVNNKAQKLNGIATNINYNQSFANIKAGSSRSQFNLIVDSLQALMMSYDFDYVYLYFTGENFLYSNSVSYSMDYFSSGMYDYHFFYSYTFYDYLNSIRQPEILQASSIDRSHPDEKYITFFYPLYSGSEQCGLIFFLVNEKEFNLKVSNSQYEYLLLDKKNNMRYL
jgi:hypothetical protein